MSGWEKSILFDDSLHQDGFYYHFTRCPIAKFCKEHGYEEINTVLCDIDYSTAEMMHGVLHREQTVAAAGTKCDYWMVTDQVKDPRQFILYQILSVCTDGSFRKA